MTYIKIDRKVKLRQIGRASNGDVTKGITMPKRISDCFENTYFNVTLSGSNIILESGTVNGAL